MTIESLHFLLTYECNFECDHCFVWGSPENKGVMKLSQIEEILRQAGETGKIRGICVEGGEPFLYYPILLWTLKRARGLGFEAGVVTNCYWATAVEDAKEWLRSIPEVDISDLGLSEDYFHYEKERNPEFAKEAADKLGIPHSTISIEDPREEISAREGMMMLKGRAAEKIAPDIPKKPWQSFTECLDEDFSNQKRVHIDPFGFVHVCQGIVIGNLFERSLRSIFEEFDPNKHPICGPLLEGGPAKLVEVYGVRHAKEYADECHLCYDLRCRLRTEFPDLLCPDQMYGVQDSSKV